MGGNNQCEIYMEQMVHQINFIHISESHDLSHLNKGSLPTRNRSSVRSTCGTRQYLSERMSGNPNGAEEQAQRNRMPGLDVVLDAILVHLSCGEEVDGKEVDPGGGNGHLAREHPHNARQLREPVFAGEHGADGVGGPGEVEQVGVEEAERHVRGGALHGALSLRQQQQEGDMSPAASCTG